MNVELCVGRDGLVDKYLIPLESTMLEALESVDKTEMAIAIVLREDEQEEELLVA